MSALEEFNEEINKISDKLSADLDKDHAKVAAVISDFGDSHIVMVNSAYKERSL